MKKSSILGLLGSGLLTLPVVLGGITAVSSEAQAREGHRLCYISDDLGAIYFMRVQMEWRNARYILYPYYVDCTDYEGGKDVPVLYRDDGYHDMSICENFTQYMLEASGDVCDYMDYESIYSKEQLESLVK